LTASRGNDSACRPNQLLAIALDHPVLDRERWEPVFTGRPRAAVHARRSALARTRASRLQGAVLRATCVRVTRRITRDVWGWLAGPFVDVWLNDTDDQAGALRSTGSRRT
jgi:hypothetical protein